MYVVTEDWIQSDPRLTPKMHTAVFIDQPVLLFFAFYAFMMENSIYMCFYYHQETVVFFFFNIY